jgi:glutaminyl-tRNA synthetase
VSAEPRPPHFIEQIVASDNAARTWGVWTQADAGPIGDPGPAGEAARARLGAPRVHTRFPPEPNGYLHIGHAKAICLNFGLAKANGGKFNLRFDDTNPAKEEQEFVDSIIRDVRWLGADFEGPFGGGLFFASNYFAAMYDFACELIKKGKAYVCELSADEVSKRRGTPTVPGTSPFRDRPSAESLRLIDEMRRGMHPDGSMTVRARIDMASPNFNLRDPVLYRILHEHHHNTGEAWCIYPMYDWAHGLEDSIEGITHSNCTLEFENHRPLYDWFIDSINEGRTEDSSGPWGRRIHHPRQIEFAKLQLSSILLSKRNLRRMVEEGITAGWDDPRMPTLSAFRRRGFTPESIRDLCDDVGCTKFESLIDLARLENACRDHLNKVAPRAMAVLNPIKVTIENWPEGKVDWLDFVINPEDPGAGTRKIPFSRTIYIEREDFMENPEKGFFRLAPGAEVRLRWAYFLTCTGVDKDASGAITGLRATIDPNTRGGDAPLGPDGKPLKKVKGTIHWVAADHALPAEVRLYDRLFTTDEPGKNTGKWEDDINPHALSVVRAFVDPSLAAARYRAGSENGADVGDRFQFERLGYFCVDPDSGSAFGGRGGHAGLVLNRTVTLKDSRPKAKA